MASPYQDLFDQADKLDEPQEVQPYPTPAINAALKLVAQAKQYSSFEKWLGVPERDEQIKKDNAELAEKNFRYSVINYPQEWPPSPVFKSSMGGGSWKFDESGKPDFWTGESGYDMQRHQALEDTFARLERHPEEENDPYLPGRLERLGYGEHDLGPLFRYDEDNPVHRARMIPPSMAPPVERLAFPTKSTVGGGSFGYTRGTLSDWKREQERLQFQRVRDYDAQNPIPDETMYPAPYDPNATGYEMPFQETYQSLDKQLFERYRDRVINDAIYHRMGPYERERWTKPPSQLPKEEQFRPDSPPPANWMPMADSARGIPPWLRSGYDPRGAEAGPSNLPPGERMDPSPKEAAGIYDPGEGEKWKALSEEEFAKMRDNYEKMRQEQREKVWKTITIDIDGEDWEVPVDLDALGISEDEARGYGEDPSEWPQKILDIIEDRARDNLERNIDPFGNPMDEDLDEDGNPIPGYESQPIEVTSDEE